MTEKILGGVRIDCVQGDIVQQEDMDAVVNAANAALKPGSGVAGAIHRAAGRDLERSCRSLAPIKPGEAVITSGFNLPNRYVIHCLGPVYDGTELVKEQLASCYRAALRLAEQKGIRSLAFPAISTGVFGYPIKEAAQVAVNTILEQLPGLSSVQHIRFVLFGTEDYRIHAQTLDELAAERQLASKE